MSRALRAAIGCACCFGGVHAHAQAAAGANEASSTATAPNDNANGGITDIVVTAERKSSSSQKVSAAISVISADVANAKIAAPQDLSVLVPALSIVMGGNGNTQVFMRGIGSLSGNPYAERVVATSIDGVYIARPQAFGGVLFDLERVEAIKGPQGTLYGRGATAGAVNLISAKPSFQSGGSFTVDIGNYNERKVDAAVNLPLSNTVAIRIAATTAAHDGYYSDGYDDLNLKAVRGSLLFKPNSDVTVHVSVDYSNQDSKGGGSILSTAFDPSDPRSGPSTAKGNIPYANNLPPFLLSSPPGVSTQNDYIKNDGYLRANFFGANGSIDWDTDAGKITVISGYRHSRINAFSYSPGFPLLDDEFSDTASVEARFASPDDRTFSYILGAYAYQEKQKFNIFSNLGVTFSDTHIAKLDTTSLAGFVQGMLRLGQATRLTAGVRYTTDKKTVDGTVASPLPNVPPPAYSSVCASPGVFGPTTTPGVYSVTGQSCTIPVAGSARFNKATWRFVLEHDLSPDNMIYANVGTGFKAGGFYSSLAPNTFGPESLTAYAVGSKNRFFGRTLQANVEAYYWDYRDAQINHLGPVNPSGFDMITENAGRAKIYGAELELLWQPLRHTRISGNLAYQHSKFTSFTYKQQTVTGPAIVNCKITPTPGAPVSVIDCSGRPLQRAPEFSGNMSVSQGFDLGGNLFTVTASERFSSAYWTGAEYLPDQYQRFYRMTDLEAWYEFSGSDLKIGAYVNNLENKTIVAGSPILQPVVGKSVWNLGAPRTYGMRLSAKF